MKSVNTMKLCKCSIPSLLSVIPRLQSRYVFFQSLEHGYDKTRDIRFSILSKLLQITLRADMITDFRKIHQGKCGYK